MKYPIGTKVRVVKIPHGLDEDDAPLYAEGEVVEYGVYAKSYKVSSDSFSGGGGWWWFLEDEIESVVKTKEETLFEISKTEAYLKELQIQLESFE